MAAASILVLLLWMPVIVVDAVREYKNQTEKPQLTNTNKTIEIE